MIFLTTFTWSQSDKLYHFAAGTVVSTSTILMCKKLEIKHPYLLGFASATFAGIGKEILDKKTGGDVDFHDIEATMWGGYITTFSIYIIIEDK